MVADFNMIQGLSGDVLPEGQEYVLPDMSALELAGAFDSLRSTEEAEAERRIVKFARVVERNRDRIWIGRYWDELSRSQYSPRVRLRAEHALHLQLSLEVQRITATPAEWTQLARDVRSTSSFSTWEAGRQAFVASARRMAAEAAAKPELKDATDRPTKNRGLWLRQSTALRSHVCAMNPKYAEPEWQSLIERTPDASAAARWMLLQLWVLLDIAIDAGIRDARLASLWDDMNYAFLASYTGQLWTNDKKLRQMVAEVFPSVRLVPTA